MPADRLNEPVALMDVDLSVWPPTLEEAAGHGTVQALIRWADVPLGTLDFDCVAERLTPALIWERAAEELGDPLLEAITRHLLGPTRSSRPTPRLPSATVVICTRDRPDDLRRCLESLRAHSSAELDVVVVDNAPTQHPAKAEVRAFGAHYAEEPRPGLNRARQHGATIARGDIVIYIDDDVVVSPGWDLALRSGFSNPEVACVTGLVLPFALETPAQRLFEKMGGFSRGYQRREHTLEDGTPVGAGRIGAGACMGFRRKLVTEHGLFAVELDAGSPTYSGGDTYAFYRLLSQGYVLVYEPRAMVRHRHRESMRELRHTLYGYSVGTYCYFLRCLLHHGESFALVAGARWFLDHHFRQLRRGLAGRPGAQPLSMTASEILGTFMAPIAYVKATARERRG